MSDFDPLDYELSLVIFKQQAKQFVKAIWFSVPVEIWRRSLDLKIRGIVQIGAPCNYSIFLSESPRALNI